MTDPKILLLSAYDIDSHRRWRKGLVAQFGGFQWTQLTLPPRHFRWRIRGNPLSWFLAQDHLLAKSYDLIIATSMVDIATLRGLYPHLGHCPLIVYFHENQLAFPITEKQHPSIDPAMVNIYSVMVADIVVFNSEYNRQSFLEGLQKLIGKLPDHINLSLVDKIRCKSTVLCVPLEDALFATQNDSVLRNSDSQIISHELLLLWNHRVEYDKGVDQFLDLLSHLLDINFSFKLILLGQRFRTVPESWQRLTQQFAEQILVNEYAKTRIEYLSWLRQADIVVSTAKHEFQGLAVMEACAMGCVPLVPDRLSYPEYFPDQYRYKNIEHAISWLLERGKIKRARQTDYLSAPDVSALSWNNQKVNYEYLINKLIVSDIRET